MVGSDCMRHAGVGGSVLMHIVYELAQETSIIMHHNSQAYAPVKPQTVERIRHPRTWEQTSQTTQIGLKMYYVL